MEGYKKKLKIHSIGKVSVIATALSFVAYIGAVVLNVAVLHGKKIVTGVVWGDVVLTVCLIAVGVVLHELIHGVFAVLVGKRKFSDLKFGVKLKDGFFYCYCKEPVTLLAYRLMLIMPLIITGLIPYVITLFFGGLIVPAAFSMLIAGAANDLAMFFGLIKEKDGKRLDHPDAPACYLLYKEEEWDGQELTEEEEKKVIKDAKNEGTASLGIVILLIAIFLSLVVLGLYAVALVMQFI